MIHKSVTHISAVVTFNTPFLSHWLITSLLKSWEADLSAEDSFALFLMGDEL